MNKIIISYIEEQILSGRKDNNIDPADDLLGSGLIDSMGIMKLVSFLEKEFEVKVPPEDIVIENFMTVDAIGNYLERRKMN